MFKKLLEVFLLGCILATNISAFELQEDKPEFDEGLGYEQIFSNLRYQINQLDDDTKNEILENNVNDFKDLPESIKTQLQNRKDSIYKVIEYFITQDEIPNKDLDKSRLVRLEAQALMDRINATLLVQSQATSLFDW